MPWEKQFNVDHALERAGEAFWSKGYKATSMRDLLVAMGIQKGSFYDTYNSKHDAYLGALRHYVAVRLRELEQMTTGLDPVAGLRAMFEAIYLDCTGTERHRGCMVINCALELAHEDADAQSVVGRALAAHEALIRRLIEDGQATGDIPSRVDADATAKAMMALIMGMRVYARSGGDAATIRTLADQAIALVKPAAHRPIANP